MKFILGKLEMTNSISIKMKNPQFKQQIDICLDRHLSGDWGDICDEDKCQNEIALNEGGRLLSVYAVGGEKIYIITEADRSVTSVMYSYEY